MTFLPKDKLIHIVENHGLPNNSIEGAVDTSFIGDATVTYSVNGGNFRALKDGKIVLTKEELKKPTFQLKIKAVKAGETSFFESDTYPLTHAVILGKTLDALYPKALQDLQREMKEVRALLGLTERDLKGTMRQLVETFEEINNKGSLF